MEEIDSTDKSPIQRVGRKQYSLHGNFSTLSLTPKRLLEQPSSPSPPPTPMIRKKCCRRRIFMGTTAGSPACGPLFASSATVDDDGRHTGEKTTTPKRTLEQPSSPSTPPTPMVHKKRRCRIFMGATVISPVCGALFA